VSDSSRGVLFWCFQISVGQLHHYVGNYSSFLRARAARQLQASQAYKAKQAEIERLQVFVDRFGAKATKASAANSRKKMIEKIRQQMPDEAPPEGQLELHVTIPCSENQVSFSFFSQS
jgi:ATP-binding cassette subfamily F protein 3